MTYRADFLIKKLGLQAHPEGGYFSETYRSEDHLNTESGERSVSTSIYFLLEAGQFSSFHRIKSDEIWHFYYGSPLNVYIIHPDGNLEVMQIGSDRKRLRFSGLCKSRMLVCIQANKYRRVFVSRMYCSAGIRL